MRFILVLIPLKQTISAYLHAAQMLFSPVHDGSLLSDNSLPHITVCHLNAIVKMMLKLFGNRLKN